MADQNGKKSMKGGRSEYTLTYGIRLDPGTAAEQTHPHVPVLLPDGTEGEMALHVMNGSLEEIRRQLHESIDAYFEIYQERND